MASGYIPLPAYQVPRNAMLDLSGLNEGIDSIGRKRELNQNRMERQDERQYQRGRNAMADQRYAEERNYSRGRDTLADTRYADETTYNRGRQGVVDKRAATEFDNTQADRKDTKFTEKVKLLAPHIEKYVIGEKDPALRAQRWNDVLSTPGFEGAPKQFLDPVTGPDLFMSTARGFLSKEKPSNVQEYEYVKNLPPEEQQKYLTVKRSDKYLDLGDKFGQPNPAVPGQMVREIPKNVAEEARQKEIGKGQGEGFNSLGKAKTALADYEIKSRLVNDEIDRAISQAGPWTTGFVGNVASYVAGTPAHDLSKTLAGIQSNLGFDTLQQMRENSPTGGALGSVTERELELLQSTWGSLMQSQSEGQFRYHLNRLKEIKREYAVLKRQAYEQDVARFGAGNVPNPNGGSSTSQSKSYNWTPDGGLQEAK